MNRSRVIGQYQAPAGPTRTRVFESSSDVVEMTSGEVDWTKGLVFNRDLTAGENVITFVNAKPGAMISVCLSGNGSTVVWPAAVKWSGGTEPTQTANGKDAYTFLHNGADIIGAVIPNYS